jgi:hypothetical protein
VSRWKKAAISFQESRRRPPAASVGSVVGPWISEDMGKGYFQQNK